MSSQSAQSMLRFTGRVAVITGAGSGIGRATALRLADEGAAVACLDISSEAAQATCALVRGRVARAASYALDVADDAAVREVIAAVAEEFGRIDVLHNNAGVLIAGTTLELELEDWDRTLAVNLRGMFSCTRAALPHLLEAGAGAIVNTASTGGFCGVPGAAAYGASKGAVINYTRQLAADYTRRGVRSNAVCPGWVPTGFNDPLLRGVSSDELGAAIDRAVPQGRQAEPAEIAAAVAFLASDDASYISGHALVVDGGMTALL